jgi:hypothetical protein
MLEAKSVFFFYDPQGKRALFSDTLLALRTLLTLSFRTDSLSVEALRENGTRKHDQHLLLKRYPEAHP